MYNSIGNFIKAFILTFFTLFLFINIIFAFDLYTSLGLPNFGYGSNNNVGTGQFFGVSSFLDAFNTYWSQSKVQSGFTWIMNSILKIADFIDIGKFLENYANVRVNWGVYGSNFASFINGIFAVFNLLFNLPYLILMLIYFLIFLIYLIVLILQFVFFVFYLFAGYFTHTRTDTYNLYSAFILSKLTF